VCGKNSKIPSLCGGQKTRLKKSISFTPISLYHFPQNGPDNIRPVLLSLSYNTKRDTMAASVFYFVPINAEIQIYVFLVHCFT
jgi:hypothetical protein